MVNSCDDNQYISLFFFKNMYEAKMKGRLLKIMRLFSS